MTPLQRRRLGRTELMVTELGLGAMDTPTSPEGAATLAAAEDAGINFVDTARDYAGSEFLIGEHVRTQQLKSQEPGSGGASNFLLASKTFSHNVNGSQRDVDRSIATLGVGRIPLYQLHDVSTPEAWAEARDEEAGALAGLKIAQFRGLVDHIGVSCHNTALLAELITSGEFDTVMLEYSAFFPETAPLIELAVDHDVGVIVMRPVGGSGRTSAMRTSIAGGYKGPLTPANLLRYVLEHPGVAVAIPGARYPSRILENVATVTEAPPMTEVERADLEAEAARLY
jgi:aryl-alcohol dehydrogenase-like predicted oxidoreductase